MPRRVKVELLNLEFLAVEVCSDHWRLQALVNWVVALVDTSDGSHEWVNREVQEVFFSQIPVELSRVVGIQAPLIFLSPIPSAKFFGARILKRFRVFFAEFTWSNHIIALDDRVSTRPQGLFLRVKRHSLVQFSSLQHFHLDKVRFFPVELRSFSVGLERHFLKQTLGWDNSGSLTPRTWASILGWASLLKIGHRPHNLSVGLNYFKLVMITLHLVEIALTRWAHLRHFQVAPLFSRRHLLRAVGRLISDLILRCWLL